MRLALRVARRPLSSGSQSICNEAGNSAVGILSAMNKSVGGLAAQAFALENISGNIANTQTTGYKRTDTSFQDLVPNGGGRVSIQPAGNVTATSRATNTVQGAIEASQSETSMAIKGDGYFVIRQKAGEVDGRAIFTEENIYTRRGDFELDKDGFLVNGAGYYLTGLPIDQATGNPAGDATEMIQITNDALNAEATQEIEYRLNLPSNPLTANAVSDPDTPGSELWTPVDPDTTSVSAANSSDFLNESISGGAVTAYDANGTPVGVQFRWAKVEVPADAGEGVTDSWQLFYLSNSAATGDETMWTSAGERYDFNAGGRVVSPTETQLTIPDMVINGVDLGDIRMDHGSNGLTQYDDQNGVTSVTRLTQDGVPPGDFVDLAITDGGRVVASYSNGRTIEVYQIPLMAFNGDSGLRRLDGGAFAQTKESGAPVANASGSIVGSSLEASNVDLGEEFTKLIVTQQAFSANSRAITTANDMLTEVLNIVR